VSEPDSLREPRKLTPAERARRRARRAWIPTGVIAILILAAVVIALTFQRIGADKAVVEKAGDSRFDTAGLAEIIKTADVQIDVRGPRKASAVGLPSNGTTKIGPFSNIATELDLVGTGGLDSIFVDSLQLTTRKDYITSIVTKTGEYDYTDLHNDLVADEVVGISTKQMGAFLNAMPDGAGGPDSYFALDVGTGTALGVPTDLKVRCNGPKGCTVTTTTTLAQK
jgi:hypothetical protein